MTPDDTKLTADDTPGTPFDLHKPRTTDSDRRGQPLLGPLRLDVVTDLLVYAPVALAALVVALVVLCGPSSRGFERLVRLIEAWRRR